MNKVMPGCRVKLAFRLSLPDGTEVDAADVDAPLELLVGDGSISPGLEFAMQGMAAGEQARLEVPPGIAFPMPDASKVYRLSFDELSLDQAPQTGEFIEFDLPSGESTLARVLAVEKNEVDLDFNHPLAGFPLIFDVHILDVQC